MNWLRAGVVGAAVVGLGALAADYLRGRRTVNRHVDEYATHWGNRAAEHPADVLHYVALGDSAAQGVGASSVDKSYVGLLAARLSEATGRPVAVTNLSVSGAVSADVVRDQLDTFRALPFTPDVVTMDIGANDVIFPHSNLEKFTDSLATILSTVPRGSFIADVPWVMIPGMDRQSVAMAAKAAELIAERGHHLVELHKPSRQLGYFRYHRSTAKDWFHPNDKGYAAWADAFWDAIEASGVLAELTPSR
ncbi:hypothetical protein GCM10028820_00310 [Tessaracoccus terricola]